MMLIKKSITALVVVAFTLICSSSYPQSNVYMITEKFDSGGGDFTLDSVFVTDPAGLTTAYSIPHFIPDPSGHDSQFNMILNSITNLGYEIVEFGALYHGSLYLGQSVAVRTIFLKEP